MYKSLMIVIVSHLLLMGSFLWPDNIYLMTKSNNQITLKIFIS